MKNWIPEIALSALTIFLTVCDFLQMRMFNNPNTGYGVLVYASVIALAIRLALR